MATSQIQLTKSGTTNAVPAASELAQGELALNYADGKLYFKNGSNQIEQLNSVYRGSGGVITVNEIDTHIGLDTVSPQFLLDLGGSTASVDNTIRINQHNGTAIRIGCGDVATNIMRIDDGNGTTANSSNGFTIKYRGDSQDALIFEADNSGSAIRAFRIGQNGSVSIGPGTSDSSKKLTVQNAESDADNCVVGIISGANGVAALDLGSPDDRDEATIIYDHATDRLSFRIEKDGSNDNLVGITIEADTDNATAIVGLNGLNPDDGSVNEDGDDLVLGGDTGNRGLTIKSGTSNKGNIFFADNDSQFAGGITFDHTDGRLDIFTGNERYPNAGQDFNGIQIDSNGRVGIMMNQDNQSNPVLQEALNINGNADISGNVNATSFIASGNVIGATPTADTHLTTKAYVDAYRPGELIEGFSALCNGRDVVLTSGTYTMHDQSTSIDVVTDLDAGSNPFTLYDGDVETGISLNNINNDGDVLDLEASVIKYKLPAGAKRILYTFHLEVGRVDNKPILEFSTFIGDGAGTDSRNANGDGDETYTKLEGQAFTFPYGVAEGHVAITINLEITDNLNEENVAQGIIYRGNWPAGGRTLVCSADPYSGSYEGSLYKSTHQDGAVDHYHVRPWMEIQTYA